MQIDGIANENVNMFSVFEFGKLIESEYGKSDDPEIQEILTVNIFKLIQGNVFAYLFYG
jgi:hypothetical protein